MDVLIRKNTEKKLLRKEIDSRRISLILIKCEKFIIKFKDNRNF